MQGTTPPPGDAGQMPPSPQGEQLPGQMPPTPQGQIPQGQQQQQGQMPPFDSLPPATQEAFRNLRHENERLRKQAEERERNEQQAEQERLKKQGEYQKLAEKHEQRVKELEPLAQQFAVLTELVKGQIDAQVKDWPDAIKFSDPGPSADVIARLAWMEKARPHVEKLAAQQRGQAPGNSPNPPPANQQGGSSEQDVSELRRRIRESGKINF